MMIEQLGFVAGDIYACLEKQNELSLSALSKKAKITPSMAQMGIGWLAREDKVEIFKKGSGFRIRLKT